MNKKCYWVYILYCANDCYYTGYTQDLAKRYDAHCNGIASKYTRSFKPLKIAQSWKLNDQSIAMRYERVIKKLSRKEKEKIIAQPSLLVEVAGYCG